MGVTRGEHGARLWQVLEVSRVRSDVARDDEYPAGPWEVLKVSEVLARLTGTANPPRSAVVLAVDGRSGAGKTTVTTGLTLAAPDVEVVHIDHVAWHHSFFDWAPLLVTGILEPLRAGERVDYRPPGWDKWGRPGSIKLSAHPSLVIIEGVGVGRVSLASWFDGLLWVSADRDQARERGIARDMARDQTEGTDETASFWAQFLAQEDPFLDREKPWRRASVIVDGTPASEPNAGCLLVAFPLRLETPALG
jgi:hypothetical protein